MSRLIERINEKEKQYVCNYYYDFVKRYCKTTNYECQQVKKMIKMRCNKPKAII